MKPETKKEIYNYLKGVKKSCGYISGSYIMNAYNVKVNTDRISNSVKKCTDEVYEAINSKPIGRFSYC